MSNEMYWTIEGSDTTYRSYDDAAEAVLDSMNESLPEVRIGDRSWEAGTAFKRLDPVAFRVHASSVIEEHWRDDDDEN